MELLLLLLPVFLILTYCGYAVIRVKEDDKVVATISEQCREGRVRFRKLEEAIREASPSPQK